LLPARTVFMQLVIVPLLLLTELGVLSNAFSFHPTYQTYDNPAD